ncbi:GDYXXLXY domain-containing protein [Massilibacterium senegalense]|uniref:GDYXXLXY domain-containing protein n=1 Tax=Massilibacterium senegalense TaxID=1632858 RepID=UPI0007827ABE|nr:GDYXXLXY domain-containing protein [Massilibacterium senegalense]
MKKIGFAIFVLMNLLILGSFSIFNSWMEQNGKEITLATRPIDPKDLFYGEYVYLSYEIEQVPFSKYKGIPLKFGDAICAELEQHGDQYEVKKITRKCPKSVDGTNVVLKGRYKGEIYNENGKNDMFLDYGIHRYYVKEGDAKQFEAGEKEIQFATILVAPSGRAKVVSIHQ